MIQEKNILEIKNMSVFFRNSSSYLWTIEDINLKVKKGEILGIIGESGSGKSLLINSILRPFKHRVFMQFYGEVLFDGINLFDLNDLELQKISGKRISMIFQNPQSCLNPHMTLGDQLLEVIKTHDKSTHEISRKRITQILQLVEFDQIDRIFLSYPFEFSGGQLQRFCIAMALVNQPEILLADEPTSSLDICHQHQIITLLKKLNKELNLTIILVTHELSLAYSLCDNLAVMRAGRIIEYNDKKKLFDKPEQDFTKLLVKVFPNIKLTQSELIEKIEKNKLEIQRSNNIVLQLEKVTKIYKKDVGIKEISLKVHEGESLGVLGRSGCGKTTLVKSICRLNSIQDGNLFWNGVDVTKMNSKELIPLRKSVQLVFQNPLLSLNPQFTAFKTLENAVKLGNPTFTKEKILEKIYQLLFLVELTPRILDKYPIEMSGGEQQRLSLARALAQDPKVIVCDEATSSLDAPILYALLKKLKEIQLKLKMSIVFISHNLLLCADFCDRLVIIHDGKLVEETTPQRIFKEQRHNETRKIVEANCLFM